MKDWIDNADSYICPKCGFECNSPLQYSDIAKCPSCGFIPDKHKEGAEHCCINCKHCMPCKELKLGRWEFHFICNLFAHEDDGWALYLGENPCGTADICECYTKRGNQNDN